MEVLEKKVSIGAERPGSAGGALELGFSCQHHMVAHKHPPLNSQRLLLTLRTYVCVRRQNTHTNKTNWKKKSTHFMY